MSNSRRADPERLAAVFKALSNPNRLRIFRQLVSCCVPGKVVRGGMTRCVGDLGRGLNIVPSTVSHHIHELKRVGLIRCERQGQRVECRIDAELLKELGEFFS